MPTGTITRVFELRGFGYITPDEGDRDLFIQSLRHDGDAHTNAVELREGSRVSFEVRDSEIGLQAVSISPLH
ncbi:MAG: cold shock domain-containing protein [Phycisphaerales bacterium]|nr:cold shock domain-containing protein [Phycisphaerales bacterium]